MRLHSLEVTAFGPYAGHEVIDFDALGADGLFLLFGDTGAGKTTLLDAIAFALFGAVPGARGQVKRLRCDLADPGVATEVALELTVQGHRMRVVRNPEYQRAKKRGDGTTTQQAKASLAWVGQAPDGYLADGVTRIDEVSRTVQRLLGMSADQFFQVVLLPQGEFARFLRADTTEREQLLERLFGTKRFGEVERWFRDRRTEQGRELDRRRQGLRELTARFAQVAGEEQPEHTTTAGWVAEVREASAASIAVAKADAVTTRATQEKASAALSTLRTREERVRRVKGARQRLDSLAAQRETRDGWASRLAAARRAAGVVEWLTEVDRQDRRVRDAEREQDELRRELERTGVREPGATADEARGHAGALREEAGELSGLVAEARQQRQDQARVQALTETAEHSRRQMSTIDQKIEGLPERITELQNRLESAADAESRLPAVQAEEKSLAELATVAAGVPGLWQKAEAARDAERGAIDAHQAARTAMLDVRERRLSGMAAELAAELRPGDPCAVCGGMDHPDPARPGADGADERAERDAVAAERAADDRRGRAVQARQETESRLAVADERLSGKDIEELTRELAEARERLASVTRLAGDRTDLASGLTAQREEVESLHTERADIERAAVAAETEHRTLTERIADRSERLDLARGEHADVAARRAYLLAQVTVLDRFGQARVAVAGAVERLAELRSAAEESLRRNDFETAEQARSAAESESAIVELERRIADASAAETAAHETLAEPELAGIEPDETVDVGMAARDADAAIAAAEAATATVSAARRRGADLDSLAAKLSAAAADLAPAEAEYAELDALTDVVNGRGQNSRRMSLRSYVLAARLEEVAVAATARLRTMSQGRYSFVHSDAAGSHGTRGGLGIDVLDDYSGAVRPSKTLSGGESFLASLALALGLADVVAAETGGALLDTLFVDEGFGTLDAETLDVVMDVLDELRAGGRVVGLVSHVEELRQRIPTRLRVRKARTGSTTQLQS